MRPKQNRVISVYLTLLLAAALSFCAQGFAFNKCDFTENGVVNLADFSVLSKSWGKALQWGPDGLPPQLLSHWRLDLNAVDSRLGFDGIVQGDPVWVTGSEKKVGNGAIFMNGQDYIEINAAEYPELTGSFTIVVWVKTTGSEFDQVIVSKGQSSWQIGIEGQSKKAFFSCSGLAPTSYLQGSMVITDGFWHRLAAVYDHVEQKLYLYVDGFLDGQADASGIIQANSSDIWIGADPEQTAPGCWFYGYIDNVRLFNHALGANDIFNSKVIHVDGGVTNTKKDGQKRQTAYKTIQEGIDNAQNGDMVNVWPGIYTESIDFMGKAITVTSAADAAVIRSPEDYAVNFYSGEQADSVLENFIIKGSEVAISVSFSNPTLRYLTVVNNECGINLWDNLIPTISNCIFWDNIDGDISTSGFPPDVTYSCVERAVEGEGNISTNPLFIDPNEGDYHLKSQTGRYLPDQSNSSRPKPENWVTDLVDSPCIDAGRTDINPMFESMPNGGRINIGAYGSTPFASKSPWPLKADLNFNGHVWNEDIIIFVNNWMLAEP